MNEALEEISRDPDVLAVEPNWIVRKALIPNDPEFARQWALTKIAAPAGWELFVGSRAPSSKIVAVVDTGLAYSHPALVPNLWRNPDEDCANQVDDDGNGIVDDCLGASFDGPNISNDPWDDDTRDSHGTHVAGIIGAVGDDGVGTVGVNWYVRIMPVKVLHGEEGRGSLSDVLAGIEYAVGKGASIINLSLEVDEDSRFLRDAVEHCRQKGVLVVSAAGNAGMDIDDGGTYPAAIRSPNHMTVAAATASDLLAGSSNRGRHMVDLAAPGGGVTGGVLSTVYLNKGSLLYRETSGTSMASPHVAGAAALLWNLRPELDYRKVRAAIMNGVERLDAFRRQTITGGRLRIDRILDEQMPFLPAIFSVEPYKLPPEGGIIHVEGVNFGTAGIITLNSTQLRTNLWSDTAIDAVIPPGSMSGYLTVNGKGTGFHLRIDTPPVVTFTVSTTTPRQGERVLMTGTSVPLPVRETWDCGAGGGFFVSDTKGEAVCIYEIPGAYVAKYYVEIDDGQTALQEVPITVVKTPGSGSSNCFIATAAYGSPLHPKVETLRRFRDRVLLRSPAGEWLVGLYYRLSPPVAEVIRSREPLRMGVRGFLAILVTVIEYPSLVLLVPVGWVFVRVAVREGGWRKEIRPLSLSSFAYRVAGPIACRRTWRTAFPPGSGDGGGKTG